MLFFFIITSIFSLAFAYFLFQEVKKIPIESGKIIEVNQKICQELKFYFGKQCRILLKIGIILFFFLLIFWGLKSAASFLFGTIIFILIIFINSKMINIKGNIEVKENLSPIFKNGLASGFLIAGSGLLLVTGFYFLIRDSGAIIALVFGVSLASFFIRVGGGIFAKGLEAGINLINENNDQEQFAAINQYLGSVIDYLGRTADIFTNYLIALSASLVLADFLFPDLFAALFLPLTLISIVILAFVISTLFVRFFSKRLKLSKFFYFFVGGFLFSIFGLLPAFIKIAKILPFSFFELYLCALIGFLIIGMLFLLNRYFFSKKYLSAMYELKNFQLKQKESIVNLFFNLLPIISASIIFLVSFGLANIYGFSLAFLAALSLLLAVISLDFYIFYNNAVIILKSFKNNGEVKENQEFIEDLDLANPFFKIFIENYAAIGAILSGLILFFIFTEKLLYLGRRVQFVLDSPVVLIGLFVGGAFVYYFISKNSAIIAKAAFKFVEEEKKQVEKVKGVTQKIKLNCLKCARSLIGFALQEVAFLFLILVIFLVLAGLIFGPNLLAGFLIGAIIVGIFLNNKINFSEKNLNKNKINFIVYPMIKLIAVIILMLVGFLV